MVIDFGEKFMDICHFTLDRYQILAYICGTVLGIGTGPGVGHDVLV